MDGAGEQSVPPAIDRFREYLLMLARLELQSRWRRKVDASDIVQQTLLQAHRHRDQFRGATSGEMAGWLRTILARQLLDLERAFRRDRRNIDRDVSLEASLDQSSLRLGSWLAADQSSPSEVAVRHERAIALAEALSRLPEAQREALMLQHWQGWSLAEIAKHMGRTPSAVAGLLKRGLRQLRESLPEHHQESP